MATVHLMTQHRPLAGGEAVVEADGATVGQIIDDLDRRFPGLGDALRAGSSAGIDGEIHAEPEFVRCSPTRSSISSPRSPGAEAERGASWVGLGTGSVGTLGGST